MCAHSTGRPAEEAQQETDRTDTHTDSNSNVAELAGYTTNLPRGATIQKHYFLFFLTSANFDK